MRRLLLLFAGTMALGACLDVAQPVDDPSDPATEVFDASLGVNIAQMTRSPAGAYYKDIVVGTGAQLGTQVNVFLTYNGFLKNGVLFGQAINEPDDLQRVPAGLHDAMIGMREGGERLIVIPSALGYGASGNAGIPPNSTLVFDVRLESITE